jgi:hypothetical protein
MRQLLVMAALVMLATCGGGDDNVQCGVESTSRYFCSSSTNKSYLCPAGSAEDAKINQDIDDACIASGGNDSNAVAQCMLKASQDGKYRMAPAQFVEDCAASGKVCDWAGSGQCIDK